MENLRNSLQKLSELLQNGLIGSEEHELRRKYLVDSYIGQPPPQTDSSHLHIYPTYPSTLPELCSQGSVRKNGSRLPPPSLYASPAIGYPIGFCGALQHLHSQPPKRSKATSSSGTSTVKVQPLAAGLTEATLAATFAVFGEVVSAVVKHGSPTYGYVNFATFQATSAALALGHINLCGTVAQITLGKKSKTPNTEAGPSDGIGLFNLPFSTTHDELHYMLKDYEGFQTIKMVMGRDTGHFKGFAFVYFDSVEHATKAKELLAGLAFGDQHVDVKFARQSLESASPSNKP